MLAALAGEQRAGAAIVEGGTHDRAHGNLTPGADKTAHQPAIRSAGTLLPAADLAPWPGAHGHEVRHHEPSARRRGERGFQNVGSRQITPAIRAQGRAAVEGLQRASAAAFAVKQGQKDRGGIEPWPAEPVDGARAADQSRRARVADQAVVGDNGGALGHYSKIRGMRRGGLPAEWRPASGRRSGFRHPRATRLRVLNPLPIAKQPVKRLRRNLWTTPQRAMLYLLLSFLAGTFVAVQTACAVRQANGQRVTEARFAASGFAHVHGASGQVVPVFRRGGEGGEIDEVTSDGGNDPGLFRGPSGRW